MLTYLPRFPRPACRRSRNVHTRFPTRTFPINEAAVVSVLLIGENTFQTVFLSTPFDLTGTSFMNWMLAAVIPLALALLRSVRGQTKYARLDVDDSIVSSNVAKTNLLT